jgi:hypothetical protein
LTRTFYCDVCGDFEGTRREVEEHVDERHDDLSVGADPVVEYPFEAGVVE